MPQFQSRNSKKYEYVSHIDYWGIDKMKVKQSTTQQYAYTYIYIYIECIGSYGYSAVAETMAFSLLQRQLRIISRVSMGQFGYHVVSGTLCSIYGIFTATLNDRRSYKMVTIT